MGPKPPAIEFDNLGIQNTPISSVTLEPPVAAPASKVADPVALTNQLQALVGIDGDLELQTKDSPPSFPWNPGPNSVAKLLERSQSPYRNIFEPGRLGIHMPNRSEYDGFGLTLTKVHPDKDGHLFVSFDFRCANKDAGGKGSWRYFLGHGPGHSPAIELFFNGNEFFRRAGSPAQSLRWRSASGIKSNLPSI